jgi:hypothetical protein
MHLPRNRAYSAAQRCGDLGGIFLLCKHGHDRFTVRISQSCVSYRASWQDAQHSILRIF